MIQLRLNQLLIPLEQDMIRMCRAFKDEHHVQGVQIILFEMLQMPTSDLSISS